MPTLKICVAYEYDGERLTDFPAECRVLDRCSPVYEEWEGWMSPTSRVRKLSDLPYRARAYLDRISELSGVPIYLISVGSERDETIVVS